MRGFTDFSKLQYLPLETFDDVRAGDSPIYVLLGLETLPKSVEVGVSRSAVEWEKLEPVPGLTGVYEFRVNALPGPHLVSLRLEGKASLTIATYCLRNRATLFTAAQDQRGNLGIHQYILPLAKLQDELSPEENSLQFRNALDSIRFIALAQKQLARRRSIDPTQEGQAPLSDLQNWNDLLYGKWLDPIMAIMASYELVRSGKFPTGPGQIRDTVLKNLRTYFGAIPDVEAIAKIAKQEYLEPVSRQAIAAAAYSYWQSRGGAGSSAESDWFRAKDEVWRRQGVPLFTAGLIALGYYDNDDVLPLPTSRLDLSGPWTAWIGAVD